MTTPPKANILIVDDTPANLRLLTGILAEQGYKVRAAPNGALALKAAQSDPPDLVLLDVMMPGMDGYAVCVQLKADERTRNIPVIFLSALSEAMDKVKAFSVGAVDYITKPFQTIEVLARVETHWALHNLQTRLAEANEELRRFAHIVSHDLRAPLTSLQGFAQELNAAVQRIQPALESCLPHLDPSLQEAVTAALNTEIPEAIDFIDSSVARMDRLVGALLKLSRLGRAELRMEPLDMNLLVQSTLDAMAHQIEAQRVTVKVAPLPEVVADRISMEQIVGNLLDNAVKYLEPDRPGEIEIAAERSRDEITFHVSDNGCGIAQADMDEVFAPFRRVGQSAANVPGEGMGLPYVQVLVRRHGGRIWCASEPGVGTTFSFAISNYLAETNPMREEHEAVLGEEV